jgi:hypothetical protein
MKRLIKLDPVSKRYEEIDEVRLKRLTYILLDFIEKNISLDDDKYGIRKYVIPLCEGFLNNTIKVPIPYSDLPLKYAIREGELSWEFEEIYAPFANTITGTSTKIIEDVIIDGVLYTYVDFE